MIRITKSRILLVLAITLCSALSAESIFGRSKTASASKNIEDDEEMRQYEARMSSRNRKVDLFAEANKLLVEGSKSDDMLENIEVAKKILAKNQNVELKQIFDDFVALKPIVEQSRAGKLVCSNENMDSIRAMQATMEKLSTQSGLFDIYQEPKQGERLKEFVVNISDKFGKVCLEPLIGQFNSLEPKLDYNRVRALKQFSNYIDKEYNKPSMLNERAREAKPINLSQAAALDWADRFVRMHVALYGEHQISKWDALEQRHVAPTELVREKFNDVVVGTCNHFERQDLIPILEETMRIAKSVSFNPTTAPGAFVQNGLADVAANYVVCQRLKNVDHNILIKNIAQYLPRAEKDFPNNTKMTLQMIRHGVENGC